MKRFSKLATILILTFGLTSAAFAEPFDELQGSWMCEPQPDVVLHLEFIDEETVVFIINAGDEVHTIRTTYEATDTLLMIREDGPEHDEEFVPWEIDDDGNLVISPGDKDALVFVRAEEEE